MKIAILQLTPRLGDLEANLALVEREAAAALAAGADLALFPELALSGYRLRDLVPAVAVRLDRANPVRDRLAALSERIPFVVGLVEESADHRFYNSAAYFEDGVLRFVHRKVYLPTYGMFDEAMDFGPGERLAAFDTRFGRVGMLVCEDIWHPVAAMVLAQDGATMLWILSNSPLRGLGAGNDLDSAEAVQQLVQTLARFNTVPAFYANRSGYEEGIPFAGNSFACGPGGRILAEAPVLEPHRLLVEFDPGETRAARAAYPLVRDERLELVGRELGRIARDRAEGRR